MHPTNTQTLYLGTSSGLFKTTDGGANWVLKYSGAAITDISFKPGSSTIMYMTERARDNGTTSGFFKSSDGGETWGTKVNNGIPTTFMSRSVIAVSPANPDLVYVLFAKNLGDNVAGVFDGLYKSTDAGNSFTLVANTPNILSENDNGSNSVSQGYFDLALAVSPTNTQELYFGGINIWKSTNGGSNWSLNTVGGVRADFPNKAVHGDIHDIKFSGTNIYASSDGGVFKTSDNGNTWTDLSEGLAISETFRIANFSTNPNKFLASYQDNGTSLIENSTASAITWGDGMETFADPLDPNIIYTSYQEGTLLKYNTSQGFDVKINPIKSNSSDPNFEGQFFTPFVYGEQDNALYAAYTDVFKSLDRGVTWTNLSTGRIPTTSDPGREFKSSFLAVAPSNSQYIYVVKTEFNSLLSIWASTVYKTFDGGTNWSKLSLPKNVSNQELFYPIKWVTVSPTNPLVVYMAYGGYFSGERVFKTTDGGTTWANISGTLPNIPVNCMVYQRGTNDGIYVGTDNGVYYRDNTLSDWIPFSTGLPNVIINDLEIHYGAKKLRAGTFGRSTWQTDMYNTSATAPVVAITSPVAESVNNSTPSVVINATVTDPDNNVTKVEFFNRGVKIGEDLTAPYSLTWTSPYQGKCLITAKATDNTSLEGNTDVVAFYVLRNPENPASVAVGLDYKFYNKPAPVMDNPIMPDFTTLTPTSTGTISTFNLSPRGTDYQFAFQYSGYINVPADAVYTFYCSSDEGSKLYIGSELVVDNDCSFRFTTVEKSGTIALKAGKHLISVNYFNSWDVANLIVLYSSSTITKQAIAASVLYRSVQNTSPTVSISSPLGGASFAAPASITIDANASDTDGSISKVEFFNGSTSIGLGTLSNNKYSFTWTGVAAGNYVLTAKATDNLGAITTSANVSISVTSGGSACTGIPTYCVYPCLYNLNDYVQYNGIKYQSQANGLYNVTPGTAEQYWKTIGACGTSLTPTVSLTAPTTGTVYNTIPASIVLTATASETGGSISKVEFYNGTTLLGTSTVSPYSYTWNSVAAGTYSLTAKAYDAQSTPATATSTASSVYVNTPPVVSITSPSTNAIFTTVPATINITASATDADGISKVEFYNGATLLGTVTTSPYTYSWTSVAAGTYNNITAKAFDAKGGITTSAAKSNILVNAAPVTSVSAAGNPFTAPANVPLTATATDADGISKVELYNGATLLATLTTSPYTYTWTNVAGGSYNVTSKAYDTKGITTTSANYVVTVNAGLTPTVSLTAPTTGTVYNTIPASIVLTATASETGGSISKVEFYNGTTLLGTATVSPYTYTWNNVAAGTYSLTAKAYDIQSTPATATSTASSVYVNTPPVVSITSPATNAIFTTVPATINITASATDADGISKVEFYNGATLLGTVTTSPYTYSWTSVAAGTYNNITAKAFDAKGGITTSAAKSNILVNAAPVTSVSAAGNPFTAPANVPLTATATDADGISKVELYNGATLLATLTTSPYTYTWTNVAGGSYNVTSKAYDTKGITTTSANYVVTVNSTSTCTLPVWVSTYGYNGNDKVQYLGIKYTANWWTSNERPDLNNGAVGTGKPWTSNGTCTSRIGENTSGSTLIYPNPNFGAFVIEISEATSAVILNSVGQVVSQLSLQKGANEINISLNAGVYFVKINNNVTKLVVE